MKLFGLDIRRAKSATGASPVPGSFNGFWPWVRESFAGAWQRGIVRESRENILAFSAVYACITLRSDDIAKLEPMLVQETADGICIPAPSGSPFWGVLRKPNRYQVWQQFMSQWLVSKLTFGNAYVMKERDSRGIVRAMYVIDPRLVQPLVAMDGSVYYQIKQDYLAGVGNGIPPIPAREMIHDRGPCLFHPLVGVSPIYACGASATQGLRIQGNSAKFFENMSRPSGMLTAPGSIDNVTAARMKAEFEERFGGENVGRLFVAGDGLKYEAFTMPANDAQLIEQLRWTVEDVARAYKVPQYKLGGQMPTFNNAGAMNQDYYTQCLQSDIEAVEALLVDGLEINNDPSITYGIELDLDGLMRMDPLSRMQAAKDGVTAGVLAPNEARKKENLPPVAGGDTPYLQVQNYSLAALAMRDAKADPFGAAVAAMPGDLPLSDTTASAPVPGADPAAAKALCAEWVKRWQREPDLAL